MSAPPSTPTPAADTNVPEGMTCEPAPDATVPLPEMLGLDKGRPVLPLSGTPPEVFPSRQLVRAQLTDLENALCEPGYGYRLPRIFANVTTLVFLRAAVVEGREPVSFPFNADQVPDA